MACPGEDPPKDRQLRGNGMSKRSMQKELLESSVSETVGAHLLAVSERKSVRSANASIGVHLDTDG